MRPVVIEHLQSRRTIRGCEISDEGAILPQSHVDARATGQSRKLTRVETVWTVADMLQSPAELKPRVLRLKLFQNEAGKALLIRRGCKRFLATGFIVANHTRETEAARPPAARPLLEHSAIRQLLVEECGGYFLIFDFCVLPVGVTQHAAKCRDQPVHVLEASGQPPV